jgi:ATP-dependent helicase/nuclease subunit B
MMPDPLFNFLSGTFSKKDTTSLNTIEYQEFTNIFEEAEYIASYCYKFLQKSPYSKIAIVLPKLKSKNIYSNFLYNYEELKVNDLLGNSILKFQATKLILDVARLLYTTENLDLKKLFILLKNPLLNSPEVIKLERLLSGKNRFVQSWSDIEQILEEDNEPALKDLVSRLSQIFNSKNPPSSSFNKLLITTVKTVEKLFPQIWESEKAQEISNFLSELFELKCETMLEQVFHFPELLETILSSGRVFEQNRKDDNNVYLCNISDVTLQSFDLVIIPGFDSDSWPPADIVSPWLSNQMQLDLNLMLDKIALGQNHYYFYELLHNPNILITRAKKQDSKKESLPSNYMLQLELLMSESIIYQKECVNETQKPNHRNLNDTQQKNREIYPIHFPNRLSATDIETLIRNPYSFYAKKILRLKKHIGIAAAPMLSEFGSFLHSIIEKYTKTYSSDTKDRSDYFINLGIQDLNTILLPEATQKIWGIKLSQIAKPFITWDEERRINSSKILTEIKGSVEIELSNRTVTITAIADRIEIDRHGHITLLDFKTGAVPSKNDVFSGLSPQLIVEAIIAKANGFDIGQGELNRLVYVKISSSKPYIQTTEIDISQNELENHKAALIALLNFYATTQNYNHDLDLLKYNDYKHLARI